MSRAANRAEVYERFKKDTADHQMTVLRDDGLYRHLRFRQPRTRIYEFDIVTWPGYLSISSDMGASVFTRLEDMLQFFRQDPDGELSINPAYWHEKCVANDGDAKEFRLELLTAYVKDGFDDFVKEHKSEDGADPEWAADLWSEITSDIIGRADETPSVQTAIEAMDEFEPEREEYKDFRFHDAWEAFSSLMDYKFHFLWRLYAIAHAVRAYDAAKEKPTT